MERSAAIARRYRLWLAGAVFLVSLYLFGYVALNLAGYFDLAAHPYTSGTDAVLYKMYEPLRRFFD